MSYFNKFPQILYNLNGDQQNIKLVPNLLAKVKFNDSVIKNSSLYYQYDVKDGEKPEDIAFKLYDDPAKHWIILIANNILDPQYDWVLSGSVFEKYINSKYSSINIQLDTSETYTGNYVSGEVVFQGGTTVDKSSVEAVVVSYNSTEKSMVVKFPNSTFSTNTNIIGVTSQQSHNVSSLSYNNDGYEWASNTTSHYSVTETSYNSYDRIPIIKKYIVSAKDYNHSSDSLFNRNTNTTTTQSYNLNDGSTLTIQKEISPKSYYDYEIELNEQKRKIMVPRPGFLSEIESQFRNLLG